MGVATYDMYQQRKCFTGMKKETDAKFDIDSDIKTCSSTIFHSKLQQKHVILASMLIGRCGQIKKFW